MNLIRSPQASFGAHGFTMSAWEPESGQLHYSYRACPLGVSVHFLSSRFVTSVCDGGYSCIMREFEIKPSFEATLSLMGQLGYMCANMFELDNFDRMFGVASDRLRVAQGVPVTVQHSESWYPASYLATEGWIRPETAITLVPRIAVEESRSLYLRGKSRFTLLGVRRLLN